MAIVANKVLRLTFNTADGATFAITVPMPKEEISQAEALSAMQLIIDCDLFIATTGPLTSVRDIKVVDTITNDLYEPPEA